MAETKRCVQCSYDNPGNQIYCLKCGKFLRKNNDSVASSPNIWTTPATKLGGVDSNVINNPNSNNAKDYKVVICPQCKQVEKISNSVLPMTCSSCGYFFQIGVDRIILYSELNKQRDTTTNTNDIRVTRNNVNEDQSENLKIKKIKRVRKEDNTSLRLIVRSDASILPQKINPLGDIIGLNGTVLKQLKTESQIKINRTPTGWYIEVLEGDCIVGNVHMNKMVQRKLVHGDYLVIGKNQIFVEITE